MRHFPPLILFVARNTITLDVKALPFIFLLSIFSYSCTSNEIGNSKDVNPESIYFDYKIRGEERDSSVTLYLQYRMGGPNGTTLVVETPAKVQLDSETIPVDSARLTGAYYEIQKPSQSFAGRHSIVFTDVNNKQYEQEFIYQPFKLKTKIPATINRADLAFDFSGLASEDYIRVILTDTSFMSKDIHEIDTVKNNRLVITADKLKNLTDGPITLQVYKEIEKPIKNGTKEGGRISVTYGLQREFELRGAPPDLP
jgi:hypothetical protein